MTIGLYPHLKLTYCESFHVFEVVDTNTDLISIVSAKGKPSEIMSRAAEASRRTLYEACNNMNKP